MSELVDLEYVAWAHERYGQVRIDMASSGIVPAPASLLGEVALDAVDAPRRFAARIADRYARPVAEAVPALGTSHGIYLTCAALLRPGDEVVVEDPTYEPLVRVPRGLGATVRRFRRSSRSGYALEPDVVAKELSERTRLVLLSSPHNPSGMPVEPDALRAVARLAHDVGAHVLVDEVYGDFADGPPTTARAEHDCIIATSSLTKRYGLGWARAGWILAPERIVPRLLAALRHTVGQPGSVGSSLGLAALAHLDQLEARADAIIGDKRALVDQFVRTTPRLSWSCPPGGLIGFVTAEGDSDLRPAIEQLCDERGVLVAPGSFFGRPSAFRIGWSAPETKLAEGLSLLGQHLLQFGRAQ